MGGWGDGGAGEWGSRGVGEMALVMEHFFRPKPSAFDITRTSRGRTYFSHCDRQGSNLKHYFFVRHA
ncbi:MAG: hypothetical protein F6K23_33620 [Okeania sp. SIO2C9]|uniref:hypothetical protein n=1 Tax=Okeania sp. SIO2C9 TaxID=2607791 RepID=UPI0013C28941|nr:hypothetical protein [Okeania sp. SIO2C9]NEQ77520.1 hypothetical protein [Okeania sp. SIO2C9]